jgi:hypothetical protein
MSDDKKFKTIEDLPNYGETFSEVMSSTEGPYALVAEMLNQATGSSKPFMEQEFKKVCAALDIVKLAQRNALSKGTDLFTIMKSQDEEKDE